MRRVLEMLRTARESESEQKTEDWRQLSADSCGWLYNFDLSWFTAVGSV